MSRLSLWNPVKTNDFKFIDRIVGEHIYAGGTGVFVHKFVGIQDGADSDQGVSLGGGEIFIQDVLFLENRDRKYDDTIYELRGQYNLQDQDAYDLTQFGLFLSGDTVFMNFHIESMVEALGRKLMPGDVLELPHLRDDLLLGSEEAINRFYVVQEGQRPSEGFDPRWWPHLWKVKLGPITDSQEYRDIIGNGGAECCDDDLRDLVSNYQNLIDINDKIIEEAEGNVRWDPQYRENAHLYFNPDVPDKPNVGFEYAGGGDEPPNGCPLIGSGSSFPTQNVNDGDFFLRTDFNPHRIFQKSGSRWVKISDDNKNIWAAANRLLTTFINNDNMTINTDGKVTPEKTNLSQVVKPKTDD